MKVVATTRTLQGSGASRRLRRANQVPGIIYGGKNQATNVSLEHNPLYHSLRVESFHSSILEMELDGKAEKVLLRDVQWHPFKQQVLHIDFQRVAADTKITMKVPLHFTGEELSPAVKTNGANVSHVMMELLVSCLPGDLPEFIEVDLSKAEVGHAIHLSSVALPKGVKVVTGGNKDPVLATIVVPVAEEVAAPVAAAPAAAAGKAAPAAASPAAKAPAKK
jgi:large subunit ribosomal protein L25